MTLAEEVIQKIIEILKSETFPVPKGFSDEDNNLSAPALYTDLFASSFVYRGGQMIMTYYADALSKVGRQDIVELYHGCLTQTVNLYKKSLTLMLEKGIYDRPPKMDYPEHADMIKQEPFLMSNLLGKTRPSMATAISVLMRSDLSLKYAKFIAEIMAYADEGKDLLIKRGWLEQPPLSTDRENLYK